MKRTAVTLLATALLALAMSNGAPTLSCTQCHVDAKPIPPGNLVVEGLPKFFKPGAVYNVTVRILDMNPCTPAMAGCGGFAVHPSAGKLIVIDPHNTMLAHNPVDGEYITHTEAGHMKREWRFEWRAPTEHKPVKFKVASIAANGDATPFGDHYGAKVITVYPEGWTGPMNGEEEQGQGGGDLQTLQNLLIFSLILNSVTLTMVIALMAMMILKKK
ncbi:MAG: hypothetical protein GXO07_02630 [Crenarchaeota archaeon]|nr:hypothetical protein [Thermoproteota archaeon]